MSKNCYVKEYKKATNADLEVYGELLYEVPATTNRDLYFNIGLFQDGIISIEGNLELWDYSKTTNLGSSFENPDTAPNSTSVRVVVNGAGTVRIKNKYNMVGGSAYTLKPYPTKYGYNTKAISYWYKGVTFSPDNFNEKSPTNIVRIEGSIKEMERSGNAFTGMNLGYTTVTGTLADLAFYKDSITSLNLYDSCITGNIEDLGECTLLTTLNKANTNPAYAVTGTIEGFVARQRAAGRTAASNLSVSLEGNNCTFNGSLITTASANNLSWTASTITFNGVTITA